MPDWLVVTIFRDAARERLSDAGFVVYRPFYRVRRVVRGRRVYTEHPLLGRYLLVEMLADWAGQFHRVVAVRDVSGILHQDERPVVAREHEVARLKSMERRGYVELPKRARFQFDQRVTVTRGPFVTHEGRYRAERGVLDVVEISLFGSQREILLPEGSIVAA